MSSIQSTNNTQIFYTNGIITSKKEAKKCCKTIEDITGQPVSLHYNDTTSSERVIDISVKLVGGTILLAIAVSDEKESDEKVLLDTAIGLGGAMLVGSGLYDLAQLQNDKNESAEKLANRVTRYLEIDSTRKATLVFHSQGADIGLRALPLLRSFKDRIEVITIGGMVSIPNKLANRVCNFKMNGDPVSSVVANILSPSDVKKICQLNNDSWNPIGSHDAIYYLTKKHVQNTLLEFTSKQETFPDRKRPSYQPKLNKYGVCYKG